MLVIGKFSILLFQFHVIKPVMVRVQAMISATALREKGKFGYAIVTDYNKFLLIYINIIILTFELQCIFYSKYRSSFVALLVGHSYFTKNR